MLRFLINEARRKGFFEAAIGVDADNETALHIYKKAGFNVIKACEDKDGKYYKMIKVLK